MRRIVPLALLAVALAACGSHTSIGSPGKSSVVTEASTTEVPVTTTPPTQVRPNIQITAKGFTQFPPDSIGSSYLSYAVVVFNPNTPTVAQPWVATQVSLNITFTNAAWARWSIPRVPPLM